mmetsp:Transcript_5999/g.9722  ORF Transcript_5999/g.9722 Transcript_5999/m.9722 type:complete len:98 (+) Transcript_5999:571-864(+)
MNLYQIQGIIGCIINVVFLIFIGKLIDVVSIKILLPLGCMFGAALFMGMYVMKDPTQPIYYVVAPLIHMGYFFVLIILMAYIQKMYPKEVRGMLTSI